MAEINNVLWAEFSSLNQFDPQLLLFICQSVLGQVNPKLVYFAIMGVSEC